MIALPLQWTAWVLLRNEMIPIQVAHRVLWLAVSVEALFSN